MPQPFHRGEYPDDWSDIAKRVKDAANWHCVRCGHVHDVRSGHTLTVHHFDGDKGNCDLWNLMALCQRCHLSVQARVDPSQGLMHEPAAWVIPHIVGMVTAGKTPEPIGFDAEAWALRYVTETERLWPWWAPVAVRSGVSA